MSAPASWSICQYRSVLRQSLEFPLGSSMSLSGVPLSFWVKNREPCHMAMMCLFAALALDRSVVSHRAWSPVALQGVPVPLGGVSVLPQAQFSEMMCQLPTSVEYQPLWSDRVEPPAVSIRWRMSPQYVR